MKTCLLIYRTLHRGQLMACQRAASLQARRSEILKFCAASKRSSIYLLSRGLQYPQRAYMSSSSHFESPQVPNHIPQVHTSDESLEGEFVRSASKYVQACMHLFIRTDLKSFDVR